MFLFVLLLQALETEFKINRKKKLEAYNIGESRENNPPIHITYTLIKNKDEYGQEI